MAQNGTSLPNSKLPVLIIGAGVSGLALAQGLRRHNIPFRLFERHPKSHTSQGHRFRISQDGVDALNSILSEQLKDLLVRTRSEKTIWSPRYVDSQKFEFPPCAENPPPYSTPVDRAWIRYLLTLGIEDAIEYEKAFASYEVHDDEVRVLFSDASSVSGSLLVGADGLKSRVRKQLQPNRRLLDLERQITWGRTPLTPELREQLPEDVLKDVLTWFMAIDKEANVQAIFDPMIWPESVHQVSDGRLPDFADYIYFAIATAPVKDAPKSTEEKHSFLNNVAEKWHPRLRSLLDSASHDRSACVPVLSSKPDIELSSKPETPVTLIGDAAHAMSPMGGAGGDTAIRNAVDLAFTISRGFDSKHLREFEGRMAVLAKEKIEHSYRGGQKFWGGKEWYEYKETDA
ncbi:FAD/NAD(P)-binding domain-containing protein [Rhizodiscina lignyota]|uniref:FAD/NAD(P)-binding domain-containing protein n=1 Tax=Rhizodiscina lignyota TaxID=1504668 RepID=A0A9P4M265_9PEZI|nr:FAD/NAD(P)-binding domain-containing protein [Rhizodiscina lignyota]